MRVGIIGGGFGLTVQAPIIEHHSMMEVVAISTMKRHRLPEQLLSGKNPPIHYKNWIRMLENESLDLLFVSSLPVDHYQMVKFAIKKKIHVVCEKPFTMNSEESGELLQLAKKNKTKVIIDFEWRYLPIRQKLKELFSNNEVGRLLHIEYHISSAQHQYLQSTKRGWMDEKQKFGGMLGAIGTHMIDCLRWLGREEIVLINGFVHTHVPFGAGEQRDADDAFFIHGKLKSNVTFSLQMLSGINHGFGSKLRLFGSAGTIMLKNDNELFLGKINKPLTKLDVQILENIPSTLAKKARSYYPAFSPFLEKVYKYVKHNVLDEDLPTVFDGHQNQVIIDQINRNDLYFQ